MLSSPFSSKENYWFFYFLRLPAIDLEFSFFEWSKDRLRFAYDVLTFTFLYINGFINLKEPIETEYGDRSMEWLNEILVRFNKKAILNFLGFCFVIEPCQYHVVLLLLLYLFHHHEPIDSKRYFCI